MANKKKRMPKWVKATLIPLSIAIAFSVALLITNAFVPVKYLTAYFVSPQKRSADELRVSYLNVDFGDSSLIEFPDGKTMLIDGGDGVYSNELSLIKYLNYRGVDTIDFLVCTSVKSEHCGGLADVVKYKKVKKAFVPYCVNTRINEQFHAFMSEISNKKVDFEYASVGKGYADEENSLFFTFLSPTDKNSPLSEYVDLNNTGSVESMENASVVIWLQYGETAFVFTSDARKDTLKSITESYNLCKTLKQPYCKTGSFSVDLKKCKVATVPAHGGENNTYAPWYDTIEPECAILSVGRSFAQYPSQKSLSDVCAYTQPLLTSEKGNIVITATTQSFTVL